MSETKEPYKWYWAYENNNFVWLFNTLDEARDHAIYKTGMFDEICGKDAFIAYDEELFFEVSENELEHYQPYLIIRSKEKAA